MSQSEHRRQAEHDGIGPQSVRGFAAVLGDAHGQSGDKAERNQHGRRPERAAVDAFQPLEAGSRKSVGGERTCLSA